jgi:hypothetical protein
MDNKFLRSDLVKVTEYGHLWMKEDFQLWFRGKAPHKDKKMETILARIGNGTRNRLRVLTYPGTKKFVYALPRYAKNVDPDDDAYFYHETHCTKCLVRYRLTDPTCEVFPQKDFKGYHSVPDWAAKYQNGLILLGEFSSRRDTVRALQHKLATYPKTLPKIERDFKAEAVVVFILDVERWKVLDKVQKFKPNGPFRFIDAKSFFDADVNAAFDAPYIYPDGSVGTL